MTTHIIITADEQTAAKSWARDASTFALAAAFVVPGYFLQSDTMQWGGLIVFFITIIGKAAGKSKKLTIAQARAELDRIEAEMGQ